jgi:hypothetical protein
VSDVPAAGLVEQLRRANARLRELLAARDAEIEALRHVLWRTIFEDVTVEAQHALICRDPRATQPDDGHGPWRADLFDM